jgi:hypothetical protein
MPQILWTLVKSGSAAEVRTIPTAYGIELRLFIDGELVWSRTFLGATDVATNAALEAAADKQQEYMDEGWAPR